MKRISILLVSVMFMLIIFTGCFNSIIDSQDDLNNSIDSTLALLIDATCIARERPIGDTIFTMQQSADVHMWLQDSAKDGAFTETFHSGDTVSVAVYFAEKILIDSTTKSWDAFAPIKRVLHAPRFKDGSTGTNIKYQWILSQSYYLPDGDTTITTTPHFSFPVEKATLNPYYIDVNIYAPEDTIKNSLDFGANFYVQE